MGASGPEHPATSVRETVSNVFSAVLSTKQWLSAINTSVSQTGHCTFNSSAEMTEHPLGKTLISAYGSVYQEVSCTPLKMHAHTNTMSIFYIQTTPNVLYRNT